MYTAGLMAVYQCQAIEDLHSGSDGHLPVPGYRMYTAGLMAIYKCQAIEDVHSWSDGHL